MSRTKINDFFDKIEAIESKNELDTKLSIISANGTIGDITHGDEKAISLSISDMLAKHSHFRGVIFKVMNEDQIQNSKINNLLND